MSNNKTRHLFWDLLKWATGMFVALAPVIAVLSLFAFFVEGHLTEELCALLTAPSVIGAGTALCYGKTPSQGVEVIWETFSEQYD